MTDERTDPPPALPPGGTTPPTGTTRPERRRELSDRWAYTIMGLLVIGALVGIVVAVMAASTGDDSTSEVLPDYVDRLLPTSGSDVLSQSTVGIDIASGYDAYLIVDNTEIKGSAEGLVKQLSTGLVQFTPGPGRPVESLPSGRNCVTAMVWESLDGPSTAKPTSWCFDVT